MENSVVAVSLKSSEEASYTNLKEGYNEPLCCNLNFKVTCLVYYVYVKRDTQTFA